MEFEKGTHIKNGINYSGGGGGSQGTTDYEDLENQPQINGVTLIGDKAVTAFGLQEVVELTKAEYDALPDSKLTDNKAYHITDYAEYSLDTGIITDAYSSTKTYTVGEYCIYNNSLYKCILTCTNVLPTNTTYWEATSIGDSLKHSLENYSNLALTHDVLFNDQITTGETLNLTQSISGYRFLLFQPFIADGGLLIGLSPIFMQTAFWVERHTQLLMEIGGASTNTYAAFARINRIDDTKINVQQVFLQGYTLIGLTLFGIR